MSGRSMTQHTISTHCQPFAEMPYTHTSLARFLPVALLVSLRTCGEAFLDLVLLPADGGAAAGALAAGLPPKKDAMSLWPMPSCSLLPAKSRPCGFANGQCLGTLGATGSAQNLLHRKADNASLESVASLDIRSVSYEKLPAACWEQHRPVTRTTNRHNQYTEGKQTILTAVKNTTISHVAV